MAPENSRADVPQEIEEDRCRMRYGETERMNVRLAGVDWGEI
jgi:hypothetical protein